MCLILQSKYREEKLIRKEQLIKLKLENSEGLSEKSSKGEISKKDDVKQAKR